jgi:hypothetical protein
MVKKHSTSINKTNAFYLQQKRPLHMMLEIQVLAWNRLKCVRVEPVNDIPTLLHFII